MGVKLIDLSVEVYEDGNASAMARPGECREIGSAVAFFASDEASYLTGQSIHVYGGWAGK